MAKACAKSKNNIKFLKKHMCSRCDNSGFDSLARPPPFSVPTGSREENESRKPQKTSSTSMRAARNRRAAHTSYLSRAHLLTHLSFSLKIPSACYTSLLLPCTRALFFCPPLAHALYPRLSTFVASFAIIEPGLFGKRHCARVLYTHNNFIVSLMRKKGAAAAADDV